MDELSKEKPLSSLYHDSSKKLGRSFSADDALWPLSWKTVEYKDYERLPKVLLPKETITFDLGQALATRSSRRNFSGEPLSLSQISKLLRYGAGIWPRIYETDEMATHRSYPSGGGLFPIELYLLVRKDTAELPAGLYHYGFKKHELTLLAKGVFEPVEAGGFFSYPWADTAPVALFMTAVFDRQYQKYGERSYRFALLEAGHISQNIYLVSEALGIKCCAIGGVREGDQAVEKLLDVDGYYESLVHAMVLGK